MGDIKIIDTDPENITDCGFCGYKSKKQEGYMRKVDWLKKRFKEGMKFKILHSSDEGDVGFIEYIPGKYAWRAVDAADYMFIHCIAIMKKKFKDKGYGSRLVEECIKDAKKEKLKGVAVLTRKGTWMVGKELFLKNGFEVVDFAPPDFEMLVKKFKKSAKNPKIKIDFEKELKKYKKGLYIIVSDQCPYTIKAINEISETAKSRYKIKPKIIELKNSRDAQNAPSPFAIFSIIYNGKILSDHPISNKRFMNIMDKLL
jgi:N-acetylglutamate synthase-like GNAT family acetyltransferase